MSKEKITIDQFRNKALSEKSCKAVKGGYKWVPGMPGGAGSNGQINWGELEIREDPPAAVAWSGNITNSRLIG
ncbi:MAG: hypothetical protein KDC34_19220 [Saprospiraceae bacterium]|nr:hypothetical protein [Saprospiraceae bacterium]